VILINYHQIQLIDQLNNQTLLGLADMLNSMVNNTYPLSYNHPMTQNPVLNHSMMFDQSSSNHANPQIIQSQQMLLHQHQPPSTMNPPLQLNQMYPVNFNVNSSMNKQPIQHLPYFTSNQYQQTNASNTAPLNQQLTTSGQFHHHTNNMVHHQFTQNEAVPMESENGDKFILVKNKRKNKKAKIVPTTTDTPNVDTSSSSTSTPSTSTNNSTSSTNTDSIVSDVHQTGNVTTVSSRTRTTRFENTHSKANINSIEVTTQAKRFAETRFAFPPFVIKFNQVVNETAIINFLKNHFHSEHNFELILAGHRLKNNNELLLFSASRETFIMLFDEQKWPPMIESINYQKIMPKHLPPQFSIVLRNVPIDIDINVLLSSIKTDYPDVLNAYRITGMNSKPSSFVRLDIQKISIIDELINKKFIYYENLRLSITEYLAPAKVLVCTKCFEIGHFRGSCKSELDHCRKCGAGVTDIKQHLTSCTNKLCCIRCKGAHEANDAKCPNIKSYRTILTKSLLSTAANSIKQQNVRPDLNRNDPDFPILNGNSNIVPDYHSHSNMTTGKKIDELFFKMKHLDDNMNRLIDFNNNYLNQITSVQQVTMKHEHQLQLNQIDIVFQHEFTSQFLSPICQTLIDVLPMLVKQNTVNDKSVLCPSLTSLCDKLAMDLPIWTNRFLQNENTKIKLMNDFKIINQLNPAITNNAIQLNPGSSSSNNNQLNPLNQ
jgi:hypothetical protein